MEETTSAVAEVTSIKLGRRWRLIYFGGRQAKSAGLGGDCEEARSLRPGGQRNVGFAWDLRIRRLSAGDSAPWMTIAHYRAHHRPASPSQSPLISTQLSGPLDRNFAALGSKIAQIQDNTTTYQEQSLITSELQQLSEPLIHTVGRIDVFLKRITRFSRQR
jgi:hypothetical protein